MLSMLPFKPTRRPHRCGQPLPDFLYTWRSWCYG